MSFHEIRFPTDLSFGALGGPERRTEIVTLSNGFEERNSPWAGSRRKYDAGIAMRSLKDIEEVIAFFEARQGQLYGFRWKDWSDFKSCPANEAPEATDQVIGLGDGTTRVFQLQKAYRSGAEDRVPVQRDDQWFPRSPYAQCALLDAPLLIGEPSPDTPLSRPPVFPSRPD